MNEVLNEGVAVDPVVVPTNPAPAPAEVAKEVAVEATEVPAK